MQHSSSAHKLSLRPAKGAHSVNKTGENAKRYAGSHSSNRMSFTTKGTAFLVACALAFCTATPAAIHVITAQAAPANSEVTEFASEVVSPTVNKAAYDLESTLTDDQFDKRVEKLKTGKFYLAQSAGGRCTVASATMILRRAAYLKGDDAWRSIKESAVTKKAWVAAGLKNSFSSFGMKMNLKSFSKSKASKTSQLKSLLKKHPEGIAVYDSSLPHAIVVTDYDAKTKTFYCADPAPSYAGKRIPMAKTWNGTSRGGQKGAISHLTGYWAVS